MENLIKDLREKLKRVVKKSNCDYLLFSGGLDTSILAYLTSEITCINVSFKDYSKDKDYADLLRKFLNLKVYYLKINESQAISSIPEVIKILETFDPAIPNDIVVYYGLKFIKKKGGKSVMTGDGADEIFAGYDYMREIKNLDYYIKKLVKNMSFSSNKIGKYLNLEIFQPYLEKEIVDLGISIGKELKIRKENKKIYGKWILRKAFEGLLPDEIIWQSKRPLEFGSGMTNLRKIIESKISDEEFGEKKRDYKINFFSKEHLYYYEIYREIVGNIHEPKKGQKKCPLCGAGINKGRFHCKICGYTKNWG